MPEASCFLCAQAAQENIHSEVYSIFIDRLIQSDEKKARLFNALQQNGAVKDKGEWCMKWSDASLPFPARLVSWAVVEGLLFCTSFCAIAFMKDRALMPGLGLANQYISRDESLHASFACMLYRDYIENKLEEREVHAIFESAVEVEDRFIEAALPCSIIGINPQQMKVYLRFTADRLLKMLGVSPLYNVKKCPFAFVSLIATEAQSNFFEKRSSEYSKSTLKVLEGKVSIEEDF
mgnify:CR=1 FL=1